MKKHRLALLGLGHKGTDSATIREKKLIVSQPTEQYAPALCWSYAEHFNFIKSDIVSKYGLRKSTLKSLEDGQTLSRNEDKYVFQLVRALNNRRLSAISKGDTALAEEVTFALAEICLVCAGIATDHEMVETVREKLDKAWHDDEVRRRILKK